MRDYVLETYPSAYVEFGLSKEEFINLTFAEYQDMIIYNNYQLCFNWMNVVLTAEISMF